jgi:MarR family transcriptional regulator for hemolysin
MSKSKIAPVAASPSVGVGLGWALATLLRDYQAKVEAALDGLPGGARAFLVMTHVEKETCHSQIAIAERIGLDKTTLTYLLDDIEQEGLIKRTTDPNDRRSRHISLTDKGSNALARYSRAVEQVDQDILARLGVEDAAQFQLSLMKVAGLEGQSMEDAAEGEHSAHICQATMGVNAEA